jgi:hypothetical protein
MKKFEPNLKKEPPSIESLFKGMENDAYTSVNIEKTSSFCKEAFNVPGNKKDICESLNNNFSD